MLCLSIQVGFHLTKYNLQYENGDANRARTYIIKTMYFLRLIGYEAFLNAETFRIRLYLYSKYDP